MNGTYKILCKTYLNPIQILRYKCGIPNNLHFEAFLKFNYVTLRYTVFESPFRLNASMSAHEPEQQSIHT